MFRKVRQVGDDFLERLTGPESALGRRDDRGRPARSRSPGLIEPLTPREAEVFDLVAAGRSNGQIATDLFVTVGTVKAHVHAICGKLGAATRVQAIVRGRELGLLA